MNIGDKQIQLINQIKIFLKSFKFSNIKPSLSGFCYFLAFDETLGHAKLKFWREGWLFSFKFCYIILKNILAIASHAKYIEFNNQNSFQKYDVMVISWVFKENFQKDGSYNDRYFKESSKDLPNYYWILISMDGYVPPNLDSNITIIKKKEGIIKYDFFSFIKILIRIIYECRFSPRKIFHYLSLSSYFANVVLSTVKRELKKNNYKVILLPYEGKPFQHTAFWEAKKFDEKILTLGYLHSATPPFPSDFVHRSGAPDLLLVHGESFIKILESSLGWPKNKLHLIQSFRFRLEDDKLFDENKALSNKIFLPHVIFNEKILIKGFKKYLTSSAKNNLPKFDIKNHPAMLNSKKHLSLKRKLEGIMNLYKNCFTDISLTKNLSICFGVTGIIFELLEKGVEVIHICSDPVFESYSEKIWPNLKVKQLNEFTFQYRIIVPRKYINFGSNNKILDQTLKTLL